MFDSLENLHNKYMETSIKKDIDEVYINKTLKRLNSVSKIIPNFSSAKSFTINGKKCKKYFMGIRSMARYFRGITNY